MTNDYWTTFWQTHARTSAMADPQTQVLRTLKQKPIQEAEWHSTLSYIISQLDLSPEHDTLDLCGGNGLVASEIAAHCHQVTVVDISPELLQAASKRRNNIDILTADMRTVEFPTAHFDRIVCYAALQYLTLAETTNLFENLHRWLKPGGVLFVGDIPDVDRQWNFFNTTERRQAYSKNLKAGRPIVGTWFDSSWLSHLASSVGFSSQECLPQPDDHIYSWFRFDFRCVK